MKNYYCLFVNVLCILLSQVLYSQNITLDASTHNTTISTCSGYLYDNSISGNYSANQDRHITICPEASVSAGGRTSLTFEQFDLGAVDKVYIYQGESISSPIMTTDDNRPFFQGNDLYGRTLMPSLMMSSGCLTVRLVSDAGGSGAGFKAKIECVPLCQHPVAELDSVFYVVSDGQMIPHGLKSGTDTVVLENGNSQVVNFKSIDICFGDSIVLTANPIFPENDNFYHQEANNCIYQWAFGDGLSNTVPHNTTIGHRYSEVNGYDLSLIVEDTANGGCRSRNLPNYRVRISRNPIRSVASVGICPNSETEFSIGYSQNDQIMIDSSVFLSNVRERYENTVFIPDGPNCRNLSQTGCYNAPVVFDQFPAGATIQSVDDIVSVCINMEHTFLGDLGFTIICPNGQSAVLKHNTHQGGADLGIATSATSCSNTCSESCNPQGRGWTYCFSNQLLNGQRGVISGNMPTPVDSTNTITQTGYYQTPRQGAIGSGTWETVDLNGFNGLVGCPLNGEWTIMVCDDWGLDNGYVFWWDLNLSQSINNTTNWSYGVPLDTVLFDAPNFFELQDRNTAMLLPTENNVGEFLLNASLVDDFGCSWDTAASIRVNPIYSDTIYANICQGSTYNANGFSEDATGIYTNSYQSQFGCDSTVVLNLTVNPPFADTITVAICNNELPYVDYGFNESETGIYVRDMQSSSGCDSVLVLDLTVYPTYYDTITATTCNEAYTLFEFNESETGIYTRQMQTVNGCDSVLVLDLTVFPTYYDTITAVICDNELPYTDFDFLANESGIYSRQMQTINGCDSIMVLDLTVNPTYRDTIVAEICEGDSYTLHGFDADQTGFYEQTLQTFLGCDSVIVLNLTVHNSYNDTITVDVCDNELPYIGYGFEQSESGCHMNEYQTVHGCDSLVVLNLRVHPTYKDTIRAQTCDNVPYTDFGFNETNSGVYTRDLQSIHGCDSIIVLDLTVHPTYLDTIHFEMCSGSRYAQNGFDESETGVYVRHLQSINGCDSLSVLDLKVHSVYFDTVYAEICQGEQYAQNGFNASATGTYVQYLTTIAGCDSTVVLHLTVHPVYNENLTIGICEGESYVFNGENLTTQGDYMAHLQTIHGCDSIVNLHLDVYPKYSETIERKICSGDTYTDANFRESEAGSYTVEYQTIHGCDSLITLNLEVAPIYTDTIKAFVNFGDTYSENGFFESERGAYYQYLTTQYGCDSVIVLWLDYADREDVNVFVPNAIMPQDVENNEFCIYPEDETIELEEVKIFNRFGTVVFGAKSIEACWDGTYKGEYVPQGVYKYEMIYHFTTSPHKRQRKLGSIMVIY